MVLSADKINVAYPGNKALDDVTIHLESGRIHILAGQNGAGKSTLIKVLGGRLAPHGGHLLLDGQPLHLRHPVAASHVGIRVVPQELQFFPHLAVWENVTAGVIASGSGRVRRRSLRRQARDALRQLGEEVDPEALVGELQPAQQQRVTIARAMVEKTSFLIFDEPTAALSREERATLLQLIRRIASDGVGVLFVSHHLEEALAIGDEVSVLRDARLVWTRPRAEVDEATLTSAMFGKAQDLAPRRSGVGPRSPAPAEPLLSARELRWLGSRHALDLDVCVGEIVGLAGLPGTGADTLNGALLGRTARRGEIKMRGGPLSGGVGGALKQGIGFVPGDRKASGLFAEMSITENLCAAQLGQYARHGLLNGRRMRRTARQVMTDLAVAAASPDAPVASLSGGNQQKVLVGRWLAGQASLLLADEPTRGVDIATRREIHSLLRQFTAKGGACVVYSSDLSELIDLCDRLIVLHRDGPADLAQTDLTPDELYEAMSITRKAS